MKRFSLGVIVGVLAVLIFGIAGGDELISDLSHEARKAVGWKHNVERPVKRTVDQADKKARELTDEAVDKLDEAVDDARRKTR